MLGETAGAGLITVPVIYDQYKNFLPDGTVWTISTNSTVVGVTEMPTLPSIPGTVGPVPTTPLLEVKTAEYGSIFLNLTLDEYNDLLRAANPDAGGSTDLTATYVGYGGSDNKLNGISDFTYDDIGNMLTVGFKDSGIWFQATPSFVNIGDLSGVGNNTKILISDITKLVLITNVPTFANDAAAIVGGLISGNLYKYTDIVTGRTYQCIVP